VKAIVSTYNAQRRLIEQIELDPDAKIHYNALVGARPAQYF
jgi:hypothetical protein